MNPNSVRVLDSKTKTGALISFIATAVIIFLPEFGVDLKETLLQKILYVIDGAGMLMSIFGLRNAISKDLVSAKTGEPIEKANNYNSEQ